MEKEILEKNKQYLKKLYFWWLEYFDTWNLSDYDENDLLILNNSTFAPKTKQFSSHIS